MVLTKNDIITGDDPNDTKLVSVARLKEELQKLEKQADPCINGVDKVLLWECVKDSFGVLLEDKK